MSMLASQGLRQLRQSEGERKANRGIHSEADARPLDAALYDRRGLVGGAKDISATATGKYSHMQKSPSQVSSCTGANWRMVCGISRMARRISEASADPRLGLGSTKGLQIVRWILLGLMIVHSTAPKKAAAPCSADQLTSDATLWWVLDPGGRQCAERFHADVAWRCRVSRAAQPPSTTQNSVASGRARRN